MVNLSLLIGLCLILFHIVLVVFLLRELIPLPLSPMFKHLFSAFIVFNILCFVKIFLPQINFELVLSVLLFGVAVFFFAFGAVYKSLSLRFLFAAFAYKECVSLVTLNELVTKKSFFERTQLLCQMGLVVKENENYQLSEQGKQQLKWIMMLRKLFRIKTSGLYADNVKQDNPSCSI